MDRDGTATKVRALYFLHDWLIAYYHNDWLIAFSFISIYRKECVFKEKQFKEDIVDLAKNINKESQGVMKTATSVAEACTDKIMTKVPTLCALCRHGRFNVGVSG